MFNTVNWKVETIPVELIKIYIGYSLYNIYSLGYILCIDNNFKKNNNSPTSN